ncbi:MAG: alpha-ketoacid dehydrogenase subunit beta [Candidatus Tectomicrobia bacterium]|nr:alpha-ketoacid dehydrogenase subunit beta [Candidatus Tectomicrobia bacterium]
MDRILTYAEAIHEATALEMARDPSVIVFGLGVDDFRGIYGTTKGLVDQFGHERVFDTPLSEDAMTGAAIGAALAGQRPIHVHIRMDFLLLGMNQIINIAAKSRYMYGGTVSVPIVIRSIIGRSWGQGAQHSQGLHALFMHIPGLKVVAPSTPYDAKGCLTESIRDNDPVMFVEHRMLHYLKGHVPEENYTVPFGKARILAPGTDITIVGISYMAVECLRAQHQLADIGISAEVIDPISLSPLDIDTIAESVTKTGRLLVVDSAWTMCGASAEILTRVIEQLQGTKEIRVRRMGFEPVICPPTPSLETLFYPNAQTIASEAYTLVYNNGRRWMPAAIEVPEIIEFRGPF